MLESVISITPILFVKMGQDSASAIDFKLTYTSSNLVSGDVNFYNVSPFMLNNTVNFSYEPLPVASPANKAKPLLRRSQKQHKLEQIIDPSKYIVSEGDHIVIDSTVSVLNFTWYNNTLFGLEGFNGFTPRTIYPNAIFEKGTRNATNILLIIDCAQEQQIGLAPLFNPFILGQDQVMLNAGSIDYLNVTIGDNVSLALDFTSLTGGT